MGSGMSHVEPRLTLGGLRRGDWDAAGGESAEMHCDPRTFGLSNLLALALVLTFHGPETDAYF